jgi:lysophospholipase L1-like esterase
MGNFPFGPANQVPLTSVGYQQLGGAHSQHSQRWQAYMANRQYFGQLIAAIGDSFTSGFNPGLTSWEQTWPNVFGQVFSGRYPTIGLTTHGRGFLPPLVPNAGLTLDFVAVTGAPLPVKGFGLNLYTYDISPGGGCTLTYSLVGDTFLICYVLQPGGGTFTWTLDGGAPNVVSTANAVISDTGVVFSPTGGAAGSDHTVVIAYTPATGPCWIDGVVEFNGDLAAGVQVYNMGASDSTTGDWANQDFSMLAALVPSLVVIELGAADWQDGFTPADVQGALEFIIAAIRAVVTQPVAFQLLAPPAPTGVSSPYTWQQYVNVMYTISSADPDIDVLDMTLRMPVSNGAGGPFGLYNANGELTNIAHSLVADTECSYLGPA